MNLMTTTTSLDVLRSRFGSAVQQNVSLAPYTSARIGGPADVLITVKSADELADVPFAAACHIGRAGVAEMRVMRPDDDLRRPVLQFEMRRERR